jgi:hypothetical protein
VPHLLIVAPQLLMTEYVALQRGHVTTSIAIVSA